MEKTERGRSAIAELAVAGGLCFKVVHEAVSDHAFALLVHTMQLMQASSKAKAFDAALFF